MRPRRPWKRPSNIQAPPSTPPRKRGLMAMLGINVTGPEWEQLTGIGVHVTELPFEELFPKQMLEHKAASGAYDMLTIGPSWVADMARAGALEPLDPYIEKYGVKEEFDDIAPAFK